MKFKNIKKKVYKKKSPSNSRSIPVPFKLPFSFKFSFPKINHVALIRIYGGVLKVFVVIIFVVAVVIVGLDFNSNLLIKSNIDSQRNILTQDLNFWQNFISQHQNYPDAYFQASILEYRLGNVSKAREYVKQGLTLYPNSQDGRKIEEFLNK